MDSLEEMSRLKKEIEALQSQLNDLRGNNKVIDEWRLHKIGFLNPHSCAINILYLARAAVDNVGDKRQARGGLQCTTVKRYQDMNARQRTLVRQVTKEIIDVMERAYAQHPWDESGDGE